MTSTEDNYMGKRDPDPTPTSHWPCNSYFEQVKPVNKTSKGELPSPRENRQDHPHAIYFLEIAQSSKITNRAFFDHNGRILRSVDGGKNVTALVSGLKSPDGLDVSQSTGRMFWTSMGLSTSKQDGSVLSANLDGSDIRTVIPEGSVHTPKQLAVDDRNRKLYICDREGMSVHRCNFDGQHHEILVLRGDCKSSDKEDQMRWCVGITLDLENGKFYWTQKGTNRGYKGRIFRANINMPFGENALCRSDIETLFVGLPEPIDLDFVSETQTLYWTDRGEDPYGNTLNKARVGDENPQVHILARQLHQAIGLKVDSINQYVYVTDLGGSVYRVSVDGGGKEVIHRGDGFYTGITFV
ncbi:putative low density lipoprotein receptor [Aspergillus nomiae NRRL 13137]|uniref:Putative low density lipoprotein receptor n=1 Tax=Aspergillus nomiae NRRL (strain ATCC 15546 / NRRL 13137 / CBS 260.88 / M93) TaxID=1509407 RepID=A0A0L1JG25_ASPN3|nr:putative low density lipoprotein receptor [Aspergillus nomiae NRRL 13137]KNG90652.1 putative low density lipoprotein receptor [Aspergillus nomiae NRRL 13137]